MVQDVILYILLIARIVIAVRLLQLASRTVRSLYWLAGAFLANVAYYVLVFTPFLTDMYLMHLFYTIGLAVAQLLVVLFIHATFYQGKKSPFGVFFAASLVAGVADVVLVVLYGPVVSLVSLMVAVNWGWHAVIAYKAYREIADERYVEDWVKTRYKLMIVYCALLATTGLVLIGYLVPPVMQAMQGLIGLFALVGVVLQFLVWVMPERFRQYLNRNYEAMPDDQDLMPVVREA